MTGEEMALCTEIATLRERIAKLEAAVRARDEAIKDLIDLKDVAYEGLQKRIVYMEKLLAKTPFPEMLATLKSIRDAAKNGIICDDVAWSPVPAETLHDYCTNVIDKVEGRKEESDVEAVK